MKVILHAVQIHTAPRAVYEALTTQRGLSRWWTTKVKADAKVGGIVDFTFHGDFHPDMEQTALEPDRLVRWTCVGGHDNWQDNTFEFRLELRDGETLLLFRQEYAQELGDETYGTYNFNWGYYLHSLKQLCETGKGTPFTPPA